MGESDDGRWTEPPILPEIVAPPLERIQVRGAQRLYVHNVDDPDPRKRRGHREAVALAWARIPCGGWAALIAYMGFWQQGGKAGGKARWGWCRILEDRVEARPAPNPSILREGDEWHGQHADHAMSEAIRRAALMLPEELRERALAPKPD